MGWKIYFWVYLFLFALSLVQDFGKISYWSFIDWVGIIIFVIGTIGLYAYTFKKDVFTSVFWKVFFWVFTLDLLSELLYTLTPLEESLPLPPFLQSALTREMVEQQGVTAEQALLFGTILSIPLLYALFKLAYSNLSRK